MEEYSIQELCDKTGLPRRTIHFYSQQGILPPTIGAGLAAHYDENHLLCLLLIPSLRHQGLRLDEIRFRLAGMDLNTLKALFEQVNEPLPAPVPLPNHQTFIHYQLPSGMILIVPDSLNSSDRQKLNQLLETARKLFSSPIKE